MYNENFNKIKEMEYIILNTIDMTIFHQTTTFDYIRALFNNLNVDKSFDIESYYNYMDNMYLYILTNDDFGKNMSLICCMLTIVYFTKIRDQHLVQKTYRIISSHLLNGNKFINKLIKYREFVFLKLIDLGTNITDIELLRKHISASTEEFETSIKFMD